MSNLRIKTEAQQQPPHAATDELLLPTTSSSAPLILSLDTATELRSVAIMQGECVLAKTQGSLQKESAARVLHDIDEALSRSDRKLCDIELFAVTTGPGSFTGLRSGLATIKAFAATLNRPVVGVPTLHAIAAAACGKNLGAAAVVVLAALPAGRGEVFAQLLSVDGEQNIRELNQPLHVSPASLLEAARRWDGQLKWAGPGAHLHAQAICEFAQQKGIIWCDEDVPEDKLTSEEKVSWTLMRQCRSYAEQIAMLGLINYREGHTIDAKDLQALYVRLSDAELKERCRG
jgi:tRNA threonylcarbamoyl adenosine modification protein YeaZ